MYWVKQLIYIVTSGCFLGAQSFTDDPVMKIRMQRSQTQCVNESDLPPVPRSVMEPPPLPLPEVHIKDAMHYLVAIRPIKPILQKTVHVSRIIKPKLVSKGSAKVKDIQLVKKVKSVRIQPASSHIIKKLPVVRKKKDVLPDKVVHKTAIKVIKKHKTSK